MRTAAAWQVGCQMQVDLDPPREEQRLMRFVARRHQFCEAPVEDAVFYSRFGFVTPRLLDRPHLRLTIVGKTRKSIHPRRVSVRGAPGPTLG
jgi:hypothetical protein